MIVVVPMKEAMIVRMIRMIMVTRVVVSVRRVVVVGMDGLRPILASQPGQAA